MREISHLFDQLPGFIGVALTIFLLVLAVLWLLLPFAIVGTNKRLTQLIEINQRIAQGLENQAMRAKKARVEVSRQKAPASQGASIDDETMTCPKCYKLVPAGEKVCNRCGADICV